MINTFQELTSVFRIKLTSDRNVSKEAIRQYCRCLESITEGREVYRVTDPNGKVTYHATVSDIIRYLISKGFHGAQASNIHQAVRQRTLAYSHLVEKVSIPTETINIEDTSKESQVA